MFGVVRIALGGWILLLPVIQDAGFRTLSVILLAMLLVSGAVGVLFAPNTAGRHLSETQGDVGRARTATGRFAREGAGDREPAGTRG